MPVTIHLRIVNKHPHNQQCTTPMRLSVTHVVFMNICDKNKVKVIINSIIICYGSPINYNCGTVMSLL